MSPTNLALSLTHIRAARAHERAARNPTYQARTEASLATLGANVATIGTDVPEAAAHHNARAEIANDAALDAYSPDKIRRAQLRAAYHHRHAARALA